MANPAWELLGIFEEWNKAKEIQITRALASTGVDRHVRAMVLLDQIRGALDSMQARGRNVNPYRDAYKHWVWVVLAYPTGWGGTQAANSAFNNGRIDLLEAFADRLDDVLPRVPDDQLRNFDEFLDGIRDLLDEDVSIPEPLRHHISALLSNLRAGLEQWESTGTFDHEASLLQLWVALAAARGESKSEGFRERWRNFSETIVVPAAAGFLGNVGSLAIQMLASPQ